MARARFELAPDRSQVWIEGSSSIHPIHATATGLGGWVALELARGAVAAKPKVAGEVRILKAGDAYLFDSRMPHRFRNVGEVPCEVVSACTPPYL